MVQVNFKRFQQIIASKGKNNYVTRRYRRRMGRMGGNWTPFLFVHGWLCIALACASPQGAPGQGGPSGEGTRAQLNLPALSPGKPTHLLIFAVSGMQPAHYLDLDRASAATGQGEANLVLPTVALLGRAGIVADAVEPVVPASLAPAMASLVTGLRPARHGIVADRLLGKHGPRAQGYSHASALRGVPLWYLAEDSGLKVAALGWPTTLGASVSYLFPGLEPSAPDKSDWNVLRDASTPWLLGIAESLGGASPEAREPGPMRDHVLAQMSCALLESNAPPNVLLVRFSQSEQALRRSGPRSWEAREAFSRIDTEIGDVLRCLQRSGLLPDSAIAVVGDFGWAPLHTQLNPNRLLAQAGLITLDRTGSQIEAWDAIVRSNGGSVFVYAKDEEHALQARQVLEQASVQSNAFRLISAAEMLQDGADPEAWFGLAAKLGYAFGDSATLPFMIAAQDRGVGGYLPEQTSLYPGFVLFGRGVRPGLEFPYLRQVDIAPTLATLLGLSLGETDGTPLEGALQLGG